MSTDVNGMRWQDRSRAVMGLTAAALALTLLAASCTAAQPADREAPQPAGTATAVAAASATPGQGGNSPSLDADSGTLAEVPEIAQKLQPSVVTVSVRGVTEAAWSTAKTA